VNKKVAISAVIALATSLLSYIRGFYGVSSPLLGRVSLVIAGVAAFLALVNSEWFERRSTLQKPFVVLVSLIALPVLGLSVDHLFISFSPHPPHIAVQDCFFQNTTVGQDMQWLIFYHNDGGPGVVELVTDIEMSSREPTPATRAYVETFYFNMSQKKLDDLNFQKKLADVASDAYYTASSQAPTPGPDWMRMAASGGVVYLTGIFRYIGHPELPNKEFCYFWVQRTPDKSERCLLHNTP
jgi:hypothetical protein